MRRRSIVTLLIPNLANAFNAARGKSDDGVCAKMLNEIKKRRYHTDWLAKEVLRFGASSWPGVRQIVQKCYTEKQFCLING